MSGLGFIASNVTDVGGTLTEESFLKAWEAALRPPKLHYHLISAGATPGAWTLCSGCGGPVLVPEDWGRRHGRDAS